MFLVNQLIEIEKSSCSEAELLLIAKASEVAVGQESLESWKVCAFADEHGKKDGRERSSEFGSLDRIVYLPALPTARMVGSEQRNVGLGVPLRLCTPLGALTHTRQVTSYRLYR